MRWLITLLTRTHLLEGDIDYHLVRVSSEALIRNYLNHIKEKQS